MRLSQFFREVFIFEVVSIFYAFISEDIFMFGSILIHEAIFIFKIAKYPRTYG